MNTSMTAIASGAAALALVLAAPPVAAQSTQVLKERTTEIPRGAEHEARIVVAEFAAGGASQWHMHHSPVFVYVLEGTLGYEMDGQEPREYRAGQAFMEPANRRNRVVNRSNSERLRVAVFQMADPNQPFLHPASQ